MDNQLPSCNAGKAVICSAGTVKCLFGQLSCCNGAGCNVGDSSITCITISSSGSTTTSSSGGTSGSISSGGTSGSHIACTQDIDCVDLIVLMSCLTGKCTSGLCAQVSSCSSGKVCGNGICVQNVSSSGTLRSALPPNPPTFDPVSRVRPDYSQSAGVNRVFWVEGARNSTLLSSLSFNVSATDPDSPQSSLNTNYTNISLYDQPVNQDLLNEDLTRITWTQAGPNPQSFGLNAMLNPTNFPSGVYMISFFANDGFNNGTFSDAYISVDDPGVNDKPYIIPLPPQTLSEGDETILNLDQYGIDPDRNLNTIGMITYSIVSVSPTFDGVKVCGLNPLTNNQNYILTIAPKVGTITDGNPVTVSVTVRATDSGTPSLSFDRTFTITIRPQSGSTQTNNPFNLNNCFTSSSGDDITLDPDSAPQGSLISVPQVFELASLNLARIANDDIKGLFGTAVDEYVKARKKPKAGTGPRENYITKTLIIGGKAHISLMINSTSDIGPEDVNNFAYSIITKPDNEQFVVMATPVKVDLKNKNLLLEVQLPDEIKPGNANLVVSIKDPSGKKKFISRTALNLIPPVELRSIQKGLNIGKPKITKVSLFKLSSSNPKRRNSYILILRGSNFVGKQVEANSAVLKSPISKQPFSLITFVDEEGLTVKRIRVAKLRHRMRIVLEYFEKPGQEDLRHFTVSTLGGQVSGSVDFKSVRRKQIPYQQGIQLPKKPWY